MSDATQSLHRITLNRRDFLRQSFAFSALATLGSSAARALPPNPAAKHILAIGDWGKEGNYAGQASVAAAMAAYAEAHKLHAEAVFLLGDSWYGSLPGGIDDQRWKLQFEDMYSKHAFPCPFHSIMGNHDYQTMPHSVNKRDTELAYARRGNTRWHQPALWYTFDIPHAKVIALDSNVHHLITTPFVDFTLTEQEQAEQLRWFAAELDKPRTQPFLIVLGHHPIFSNGPHGDHKVLMADWEPLLRKARAHLYLAGHDHDLQHLEFEGHPTSFVSSGAGGADLYDLKIPETKRGPFAEKVYGFTHLELSADTLTIRHIDADSKTVHTFSKSVDGTVTLGA